MKISVIIPTYNRSDKLKNAIEALLKQSRLPDEIIIVSRETDSKTNETISSFESSIIRSIKVGEISKITVLENIGVSKASGDIYVFCDDDTVAFPEWIKLYEEIFQDEKIGAAGGPSIYPEEDGEKFSDEKSWVSYWGKVVDAHEYTPSKPYECHHYPACNMAVRRSAFRNFDETLLGYHYRFELDLCMHIKRQGFKLICHPELKQLHYPGRKASRQKGRTRREVYETHANNTYVIMKNFTILQRFLFLPFTFIWGDSGCPGVIRYMLQGIKQLSPSRFILSWWAFSGKMKGISMWVNHISKNATPS